MRRYRLAVLVVAAGLAGWHASASAQGGTAPGPGSDAGSGATAPASAGESKPGPARPAPPEQDPSPDFVPSETVSSGKPVSFPTDI
jgi:hypothetical protein